MEISGKLNRTAERYMEMLRHHGLELTEPERLCLAHICHIGFMSPLEISELPFEVSMTAFECEGLDKVGTGGETRSGQLCRPGCRRRVAGVLRRTFRQETGSAESSAMESELQHGE
jgi:hypothetical protein